jgi:hypothetical protein
VLRLLVLSLPLLVGDGVVTMLVLACDVDVKDDAVVSVDAALEAVGDFCSHSMGDHEALATAVNVSVGVG